MSATYFVPHGLITLPALEIQYQRAHFSSYEAGNGTLREHHTIELLENIFNKVLFKNNDNVFVNSQEPPAPESNSACDIAIKYVEQGILKTKVLCFVKCKRDSFTQSYSLRAVEEQASEYCQTYLKHRQLDVVYAATGIGVHLRLWKAEREKDLYGMWGNPARAADWTRYYDVGKAEQAREIARSFELITQVGPGPVAGQRSYVGENFNSPAAYSQFNPPQPSRGSPSHAYSQSASYAKHQSVFSAQPYDCDRGESPSPRAETQDYDTTEAMDDAEYYDDGSDQQAGFDDQEEQYQATEPSHTQTKLTWVAVQKNPKKRGQRIFRDDKKKLRKSSKKDWKLFTVEGRPAWRYKRFWTHDDVF